MMPALNTEPAPSSHRKIFTIYLVVVEAAKWPLPASCSVITRLVFAMRNVKCIDNILRCGHCGHCGTRKHKSKVISGAGPVSCR